MRSTRTSRAPDWLIEPAKTLIAGELLDGHRLAGDPQLVDEGVPAGNCAVDGDTLARRDEDGLADVELVGLRPPSAGRRGGRDTSRGSNSSRSRIARRPRSIVSPSSTSATSTKKVTISATKK